MPKQLLKNLKLDEVSHCGEGVNPHAQVVLFKSKDSTMPDLQTLLKANPANFKKSDFEAVLNALADEKRKTMPAGTTFEQAYAELMRRMPEAQQLAARLDEAQDDPAPEETEKAAPLAKAERDLEARAQELRKANPKLSFAQAYSRAFRDDPAAQAQLDQLARADDRR